MTQIRMWYILWVKKPQEVEKEELFKNKSSNKAINEKRGFYVATK